MKVILPIIAAAMLLCAGAARAEDSSGQREPGGGSGADQAYARLSSAEAKWASLTKALDFKAITETRWYEMIDEHQRDINALAAQFLVDYPADPRRYEAMIDLLEVRPDLPMVPGKNAPGFKADPEPVPPPKTFGVSKEELAAWDEKMERWATELAAAQDLPPDLQKRTLETLFSLRINQGADAVDAGWPIDLEKERVAMEMGIASNDPQMRAVAVENYFYLVPFAASPERAEAIYRAFLLWPDPQVRKAAQDGLQQLELLKLPPLDLSFTALDGRKVDLAAMRGKVVLLDFWATWCGHCVDEIPNVKKVYDKYHDQGFEVIGVSLDFAKDREKLAAFVARRAMPWPENFAGARVLKENPLTALFGITSIPAMYLLNQDGKIVCINARGAKLEAEVRRLLRL